MLATLFHLFHQQIHFILQCLQLCTLLSAQRIRMLHCTVMLYMLLVMMSNVHTTTSSDRGW